MDLNWTQEAVLAKMGGLPGRHEAVLRTSLGLHLGSAFPAFHRSAVLLLRPLFQAGVGKVQVLERPDHGDKLKAVLAELPPGAAGIFRVGDWGQGEAIDLGICVGGTAVMAAELASRCSHGPFLWLNCCGPLVLLLFFDGKDGAHPEAEEALFLAADRLLIGLAAPVPSWRVMLCAQFALFLMVSYVSRTCNGTGSFPWLLVDLEQARMCTGQHGLQSGIERVCRGEEVLMEDLAWVDLVSG